MQRLLSLPKAQEARLMDPEQWIQELRGHVRAIYAPESSAWGRATANAELVRLTVGAPSPTLVDAALALLHGDARSEPTVAFWASALLRGATWLVPLSPVLCLLHRGPLAALTSPSNLS